jgi:DnaJ-class molecular chaperone
MTTETPVPTEGEEVRCDGGCHNTNVFAPGNYKVTCDVCGGRRGHHDKDNRWIECRNCEGAGNVRCPKCHGSGTILLPKV